MDNLPAHKVAGVVEAIEGVGVSTAARNSPESSGRNSPLYSGSVTAKSPRRSDIGEGIEVEIDNLLKRLGGGAVAQAFRQGVGPGGILGL
jgi:hypothetical protein